jgi:hypothetical protein
MEGGTIGTNSLIYPGPSALDGGWTDPWKKDRLAYPHDPRIIEEVGSLSQYNNVKRPSAYL